MFPVSNHTSCETSTNTVKTSNPSAAKQGNAEAIRKVAKLKKSGFFQ